MKNLKTVSLPHYAISDDGERLARARMFADEMATRRSVRDFSPKPVSRDVIEACIRTAATAPSGANQQAWHFVAVSNPDAKKRIRDAAEIQERDFYEHQVPDERMDALAEFGTDANKSFLEIAPWLIAIFYEQTGREDDKEKTKRYYPNESAGIASGFLIAALHKAGLAVLTYAPSSMAFLNETLGRPKNEVPYMLLVVGHPAANCQVPDIQRKTLSDIATLIE